MFSTHRGKLNASFFLKHRNHQNYSFYRGFSALSTLKWKTCCLKCILKKRGTSLSSFQGTETKHGGYSCLLCSGRRWWATTAFPSHFPPPPIRLPLLCPSRCWLHLREDKQTQQILLHKVHTTWRKYMMWDKSTFIHIYLCIRGVDPCTVMPHPALSAHPQFARRARSDWGFPATSLPSLWPEWALGLDRQERPAACIIQNKF